MSTPTITPETALERFIQLFREEESLKEDQANLAEEAKAQNIEVAPIKAAAKLIASEKYAAYREKQEAIFEVLDRAGK